MGGVADVFEWVMRVADISVSAAVIFALFHTVTKLAPRLITAHREGRRDEIELQGRVYDGLQREIKTFGGRVADAIEKQADATSKMAEIQREQHVHLASRLETLAMAQQVNTQLLERVGDKLERVLPRAREAS